MAGRPNGPPWAHLFWRIVETIHYSGRVFGLWVVALELLFQPGVQFLQRSKASLVVLLLCLVQPGLSVFDLVCGSFHVAN
ncbi:MAG TPA: hypothetical protein VEV82_03775 [Actinomycetota bacterium]|nr:hypothetical protein [Actinomycetota bacterium]